MQTRAIAILALAAAVSAATPQMDDTTRQQLLTAHNTYRQKVSPTATDMIKLTWNSSLETIANNYATCSLATNLEHNPLHATLLFGENLQSSSASDSSMLYGAQAAVDDWASEESYAAYPYDISSQGHWTQMIWATTATVGCVYIDCPDSGMTTRVWVCDYYPAGNWVGESVYLSGTSCSACPTGTTCDSTGALCASTSSSPASSPSSSPAAAASASPSHSPAAAASASPSRSPAAASSPTSTPAAASSATPSATPAAASSPSSTPAAGTSPAATPAAGASPSVTPNASTGKSNSTATNLQPAFMLSAGTIAAAVLLY